MVGKAAMWANFLAYVRFRTDGTVMPKCRRLSWVDGVRLPLKKPQAFAAAARRVRKLIVYETYPNPGEHSKAIVEPDVNRNARFHCRNIGFVASQSQVIKGEKSPPG
jgi:hypothetical protein